MVSLRAVAWAWRRGPAVFCLSRVAARDAARVDVRDDSQLSVIRRQRQTCLSLSVFSTVLLVDSLVVTHVEFPTFLSFESETCRASVVWETRG